MSRLKAFLMASTTTVSGAFSPMAGNPWIGQIVGKYARYTIRSTALTAAQVLESAQSALAL